MNKKTLVLSLLLISVLSGCITEGKETDQDLSRDKQSGTVIINGDSASKISTLITRVLITDDKGERKLTITEFRDGKKEKKVLKGEEIDRYVKKHKLEKQLKEGKPLVKVRTNEKEEEFSVDVNMNLPKLLDQFGITLNKSADSNGNVSIRSTNVNFNLEEFLGDLNFDIDMVVEEDSTRKKVIITTSGADSGKKKKIVEVEVVEEE